MSRSRFLLVLPPAAGLVLVLSASAAVGATPRPAAPARPAASRHMTINCDSWRPRLPIVCPDVYNSQQAFGYYVGHDEPGVHFYSNVPGSGNRSRWLLTLPTEPSPSSIPGRHIYSFENHIAFWFGMAICASQSYPEQLSTCPPDTDANIVNPKVSPRHVGSAYLELQFYPPGYAPFPAGVSCDATHWCAAMNVWSYYFNPVTGQGLNRACQAKVGGIELDNFAFITRDGRPTGPPNPLDANTSTFTPNADVLQLGQGDRVAVTIQDSPSGLLAALDDQTTRQTGYMIASARNGFGQMVFAPAPSTECKVTPYTFRPMYSTSTTQTRATWTAIPYNVAYSDETGHFDYCSRASSAGACTGAEGAPGDHEKADSDDTFGCFNASQALLYQIGGCVGGNYGFDGPPYLNDWPNGQPTRATPIMFTSPRTGAYFTVNYRSNSLVTDLPLIEASEPYQHCDIFRFTGCHHFPLTDDRKPAPFYPYFYTTHVNGCTWAEGTDVPGLTVNDFGKQRQYGSYDRGVWYTGMGGTPYTYASVFRQIYPVNLCPAGLGG